MENIEIQELAFLADVVTNPADAFRFAERYQITDESFAMPQSAELWRRLVVTEKRDPVNLVQIAVETLGLKTGKAQNDFLSRVSVLRSGIIQRAHELAMAAYRRAVNSGILRAQTLAAEMACDSTTFAALIREAVDSVPRVPEIDWTAEQEDVSVARDQEQEIPEHLLHMGGFVDALTDYTLQRAHNPHRTLAFSGALALLAHLMGRKFTDYQGTRPNLYLIALGPTAIGKEIARKVNRLVAGKVKMAHTIADQIASGEAIEDFVAYSPSALIQMDEIHKTLAQLKDGANAIALGISKFLLTFYSAAGSDHMMRLKAAQAQIRIDPVSRVIHDPSLTLYGTGVPHVFYRSLTLETLEDGLVGRCLAFEAMHEGEANEFEGPRPVIPSLVMALAEEMSARNLAIGVDRETDPVEVPYLPEARKCISKINKEAKALRMKCGEASDYAGYALWGRAAEKVAKLVLIHAVSVDYANPVVTPEIVDMSWRLVKFLTERMISRASRWICNSRLDESCARVVDLLERAKDRVSTRREVMRKLKLSHDEMVKVEATLEDRGEVSVKNVGKGRAVYSLVESND